MNIVKSTGRRAPIFVLYGAEGRGKSTLASKFNRPLFFDLEKGLPLGVSADTVQGSFSFPTPGMSAYGSAAKFRTLAILAFFGSASGT